MKRKIESFGSIMLMSICGSGSIFAIFYLYTVACGHPLF